MTATPHLRALEQALAELPETVVGEIIFGRLVTQPRPATRHALAATRLVTALGPPFDRGIDGPGGWTFLFEPELQLGPHVLVPDVAGWRRETMPELPDVARVGVVPDWVCEVLSPGTDRTDRSEKMTIYAANGVGHLWLVDPRTRTITSHRGELGQWVQVATFEGDAPASIAPFDAIELPMHRVWSL